MRKCSFVASIIYRQCQFDCAESKNAFLKKVTMRGIAGVRGRGREMTEERWKAEIKWKADERGRKVRKMNEVRVMVDDRGTEIEKEGWLVGKPPLQSV